MLCFQVCALLEVLGIAAVKVVRLLEIATTECASLVSTVRDGSTNYYCYYYRLLLLLLLLLLLHAKPLNFCGLRFKMFIVYSGYSTSSL